MVIKSTIAANTQNLQPDLDKLAIWEGKCKMAFLPDECIVLSVIRDKIPIKCNYTLKITRIRQIFWINNQTRFKMERLCKKSLKISKE
jgi:hypothetical protein